MRAPFDVDRVTDAVEEAITSGQPVVVDGLIVCPDLVVLGMIANGAQDLPDTWRVVRDDGRSASIYRDPRSAS